MHSLPSPPQLELNNNRIDCEGLAAGGALPKTLKKLNLSGNALSGAMVVELPSRLTTVDLSDNALTELGDAFAGLVNVKELTLDGNRINLLGPELGGMAKLQVLSVRHNQVQGIAPAVFKDTHVDRIHLEGNPMTKRSLMAMVGFGAFDGRRTKRLTKEIAGGLHDTDRSVCGLD